MPGSPTVIVVLLVASICPISASAQDLADEPLDQILQTLKPNQVIRVTDESGKTIEGRISELSETTLALLLEPSRRNKGGVRSVPRDAIATIRRPDGLANGLLIGLAAGIAANYVFVRANCGPPGYDAECSAQVGLIGFPVFVPIGVAVGMLVDKAITRTLYRAARKQ